MATIPKKPKLPRFPKGSWLAAVHRAARYRQETDEHYRQTIVAAREAGHTLDEIGQAAGLTKQGVRYLLYPDPRKEQRDGR